MRFRKLSSLFVVAFCILSFVASAHTTDKIVFQDLSTSQLLWKAFQKSEDQMIVVAEVLLVLLFVFSAFLFLAEKKAQPNVYKHFHTSLLWNFVKCIRDPGEMAPPKPKSLVGKFIANGVGLVGIALFAIPAGLISSSFKTVMEEQEHAKQVQENIQHIKYAMRWTRSPEELYTVPIYYPMDNLITKKFMSEAEIIEAVKNSDELHLYNLGKAFNAEDVPNDQIVVVACPHNRPYGYCIDRKSNVTIVSTSGYDEPMTSWVAYHIAKIGGFNYVACEIVEDIDNPSSYYNIDKDAMSDTLKMFISDIDKMSSRANSWVIPMAFCNGPNSRKEKIHLCYSPKKGDQGYETPDITMKNVTLFEAFYIDLEKTMNAEFEMLIDKNGYYSTKNTTLLHFLKCKNGFNMRCECPVFYFNSKKLQMIQTIADVINRNMEPGVKKEIPAELKKKNKNCFAYDGYIN